MYTSLLIPTLLLTSLLPPSASSLTLPQNPSLALPNTTTQTPSSLTPNTTTHWPPTHTWPPTPFPLTIPDQDPPAFLNFLQFARPGLLAETDALLAAIDEQLDHYSAIVGLAGPFTIVNADVRFWLRLATPTRGQHWLSKELAVAALEVFREAVEAAGAREGMFVVVSGEGIKGTFWVGFLDAVGG